MKVEITPENKAKFFAQYWGQRVFTNQLFILGGYDIDQIDDGYDNKNYLCLISLENIKTEHIIELSKLYFQSAFDSKIIGNQIIISYYEGDNISEWVINIDFDRIAIDYLRSKGYAVDWMGLTVEEMIEAGWIKLIEL